VIRDLAPDLVEDLLRSAQLRDLAGAPAGALPLRDVDGEDPPHASVAALREVDAVWAGVAAGQGCA
jgi:hypothetical protein